MASNLNSISTHALTWRATDNHISFTGNITNFYPRPHVEGDFGAAVQLPSFGAFLPTPSRGGRPADHCTVSLHHRHFYPRPHVEGDIFSSFSTTTVPEFLPTPSRGGRPVSLHHRQKQASYFYPRPHVEGDTIMQSENWNRRAIFLPTPSRRGRRPQAILF